MVTYPVETTCPVPRIYVIPMEIPSFRRSRTMYNNSINLSHNFTVSRTCTHCGFIPVSPQNYVPCHHDLDYFTTSISPEN